jgi:hypothetical protein
MLDHDALSFSLVPFCYGVCPFVNQLHPLPSATSGIPGWSSSILKGAVITLLKLISEEKRMATTFRIGL